MCRYLDYHGSSDNLDYTSVDQQYFILSSFSLS